MPDNQCVCLHRIKNITDMKTKALIFFFATLCMSSVMRVQAQTLTLEVRDIDRSQGFLYVAVYSSPDNFLKKPLTGFRVEVKDKTLSIPCKGLPQGTYALALFQDLNGNNTLDTGAFGIPQEPTGFSRDTQGVMGPPSFEQCCFTLRRDTTLVVHIQ